MDNPFVRTVASAPFLAVSAVVVFAAAALVYYVGRVDAIKLPPGPKPLPIVGNIKDLPPAGCREWEHWLKHKDLYGPISSVTAFGTTIVVFNDLNVATEVLEKRANIHSSRPHLHFAGDMCGQTHFTGLVPYDNRLRAQRRMMHAILGTQSALADTIPIQEAEMHRFLFRTLQKPAEYAQHIRTEAGAMILKITYNYTIETEKPDPLIDIAEKVMDEFGRALIPGAWLVDTIPILKYVPSWFPGADFKRLAKQWKTDIIEMGDLPFRFVKHEMKQGRAPSFVSKLVDRAGENATDEEEGLIIDSANSLFAGGADTTVAALQTFFLAMTLHPDVQRRAHEEIDRVVGTGRLPCLDDRANLPYVSAVVNEALRWHPITPMGLPHTSTVDDMYQGYRIPKDAILIANFWWFAHDPATYSDPMSFKPERFLGEKPELDPKQFIFGFGRRVCPGRLLAESSVWLTMASSLAVFNIGKPLDRDGREMTPEVLFTSGVVSRPKTLQANIKPRSARHEALIREVEIKHPWEKSGGEVLLSLKK